MVATHVPDQFKSVMKTQDNKKKKKITMTISILKVVWSPLVYLRFDQYLMVFADFCQQTVVTRWDISL